MVEESAGNVTLCMYICDGGLKRNASFTFATQEITALCELHMYCTVLCVVTTSSCIQAVYVCMCSKNEHLPISTKFRHSE